MAVFAPLNPALRRAATSAGSNELRTLRGVVFDMDGTLCLPQTWMFSKMREALGIEKRVDILDHIDSLPTPSEQKQAHQKIQTVEREAMSQMVPQPGLVELMSYLDSRGIKKAICTRNFESPVQHLLTSFLGEFDFEPLITRSFKPPKPSPAGVLHIARKWGFGTEDGELAEDMIMVGDSLDDMLAGRAAGTTTVLLKNAVNTYLVDHESTDAVIERLDDLIEILEEGKLQVQKITSPDSPRIRTLIGERLS